MSIDLYNQILSCEWFPSSYLFISENVFTPLLYYTYLGSVIPALFIAFFVFTQGKKTLPKLLLLLMVLSFSIWVFGAMVVWATEYPSLTMFFWTVINLFEPLVYFFAFYFFYAFVTNKDFTLLQKLIFISPLFLTVILAPTKLMLMGYNLWDCERNAVEGILSFYDYTIEIFYVLAIIVVAFLIVKKAPSKEERRKIFFLSFGLCSFLLSFSLGNILESFTENWYIGQYGLLGAPVFTAILAYMIVKYESFNIRLLGAQALISTLWILVLSLLFLDDLQYSKIIVGMTLFFLTITGVLLIKSVRKDHEQTILLQSLTHRLEDTNDKLESSNERLKELDLQKDEFLSIASHQLRAPIGAIRGFTANLLDGTYGKLAAYLKEPLENVDSASRLMAQSIEDYLNISRIEQGRMKYEMINFDIVAVVKTVIAELKVSAEQKKLTLGLLKTPEELMITADLGKVKQVVSNIVDNAIKYTESGSINLEVTNDTRNVTIQITDTGVGIAKDEIGNLFTKFLRARNAKDYNTSGTGLGLYVAKQLVEGHKGTIQVNSPGQGLGSTFIIILPLA